LLPLRRRQPVTAGDISRQREVKRQAVSSPFFSAGFADFGMIGMRNG